MTAWHSKCKLKSCINAQDKSSALKHSDSSRVTRLLAQRYQVPLPLCPFQNQAYSIFHILSESCDSVRTVTSEAAAKQALSQFVGSHVSERARERGRKT